MRVILLLIPGNVFMTVAWYGHLRFVVSPVFYPRQNVGWNAIVSFSRIRAAVFFAFLPVRQ